MDDDDIDEQASYIDWILYAVIVVLILVASSYALAGDATAYYQNYDCRE